MDFQLSKSNRRGIIILSLITLGFIYFPRVYFYFQPKEKISIHSFPSEKWVQEHKIYKKFTYSNNRYSKKKFKKYSIPPHKFDPNQYSKIEWMKLGLSEKQANVIMNFTQRGIFSNDDLKKIFVISDELFNLMKDSTFYQKKEFFQKDDQKDSKSMISKIKIIELNGASEEELLELKGIGSFFAKQIIKKRNELGGFYNKEQLLEVWKMDQEKYEVFKDQISLDPILISKINLNAVTLEQLKIHPYLRWNIANSIIKMRDQRNGFKSIDEIKESVLINNELFEKLRPYLSL